MYAFFRTKNRSHFCVQSLCVAAECVMYQFCLPPSWLRVDALGDHAGSGGYRWERRIFLGTVVERAKILRGWSALRVPWPLFKATVDLSHPIINNVILGPKKVS